MTFVACWFSVVFVAFGVALLCGVDRGGFDHSQGANDAND